MLKRIAVSLLVAFALVLPASLSFSSQPEKVMATVTSPTGTVSRSLPSSEDINLNDASDSVIRNYYSSLDGQSLSGTSLLSGLKDILENMYYFDYDDVWGIYEITDRDWDSSPASETTYGSYDSGTGLISSYTYGTSSTNSKNDPYAKPLYRDESDASGQIKIWGSHVMPVGINREHVWPQSRGFKANNNAEGPAGTDVHHLMAGDSTVNSTYHSNYPYGNVDIAKNYDDASSDYSYAAGNLLGTSEYDGSSKVFEPRDDDKGNIARAVFYMAARYNNWAGETGVISAYEPFLEITDKAYTDMTSISSSDTKSATMGILHDLLEWHEQDPVDEYEIHRNNLIYNNYQANRNPFIDYPEWVAYIWGTSEDMASQGSANPASDIINGYGIELSLSSLAIEGTSTATVTATINNPSATFSWEISDSSVASMTYSGSTATITGVSNGSTTLTVSDTNGNSATCSITVTGIGDSSSESPSGTSNQGFVRCTSLEEVATGTYVLAANATNNADINA